MEFAFTTSDAPPSLDPLLGLLADELARVEALIGEGMQTDVPLVGDISLHLLGGGKRLRPLLALASARLPRRPPPPEELPGTDGHVRLAAAVEFIHNATLLHDDVVDQATRRRGRTSANVLWSNQSSVLVGDFLFTRAFRLMVSAGSMPALEVLSDAAGTIATGEIIQLSISGNPAAREEDCMRIVSSKTAALFSAACAAGALVSHASPRETAALGRYGHALGVAFQLCDDLLDYEAGADVTGKNTGDDLCDGKITLPLVLCWQRCTAAQRALLDRVISNPDMERKDVIRAHRLVAESGALHEVRNRARKSASQACEALAIFPPSPLRDAMGEAAGFAFMRTE